MPRAPGHNSSPPLPQVREPTIAEVVKVAELLDLHFDEGRFKEGWDDDRVARDLDLPRALVVRIREASPHHGPLREDPAIVALRSEIAAARQMHTEFGAMLEELSERLTVLEKANKK